jgi:ornithine cyclodeaminase/alanine dehydrogenase-like protein (mu-crystallin family)
MKSAPLLYLSRADVRRALPMPAAIAAMKEALIDLGAGGVTMPPRTKMSLPGGAGAVLLMPSSSALEKKMAVKFLTQFPGNRSVGLPLIQALVILADAADGRPLAILDGRALTSLRTGAIAGLATAALARAESSVAAVFGAGTQARALLEAVASVREIHDARIFDTVPGAAAEMASEMGASLGLALTAAVDPAAALRGADIVCTATTAKAPVFEDRDLEPGSHINAVGVFQPEFAEIPPETVQRARVVVDQREAAFEEAGDLLRPFAAGLIGRGHFSTELGEILAGKAPGRRGPLEITLFKSVGLAVQDLYAASRAYASALRLGIGTELPR